MNHQYVRTPAACFLALFLIATVSNAQSKRRENPTPLNSNEISGVINSEAKGSVYYYSFWANPGELFVTLRVQPGKSIDGHSVLSNANFKLFDDSDEIVSTRVVATDGASKPQESVAKVEIKRRQRMLLTVGVVDGAMNNAAGARWALRIGGSIDISDNKIITEDKEFAPLIEATNAAIAARQKSINEC